MNDKNEAAGPATTQAPQDHSFSPYDEAACTACGDSGIVTDIKGNEQPCRRCGAASVPSTAAVERVPSGLKGLDVYLISMASRVGVEDGKQLRQWAQALAQPEAAPAQQGDAPSPLSVDEAARIEVFAEIGYEAGQASVIDRGPAWSKLPVADALVWMNAADAIIAALTPPAPAAATQQAERSAPAGQAWVPVAIRRRTLLLPNGGKAHYLGAGTEWNPSDPWTYRAYSVERENDWRKGAELFTGTAAMGVQTEVEVLYAHSASAPQAEKGGEL